MSDLVLSIFITGPPAHPRYQIAIPDLEFWTGNDWTEEESDARPSGQRTRIHVRSHDEPSGYRVVEGQPVHVHVHSGNGQSICIEITTD